MSTSPTSQPRNDAYAVSASATREILRIALNDGRTIELALADFPWLRWLKNASDEQRANWVLEPGGFAVFWPELDDGVEVRHLLGMEQVA